MPARAIGVKWLAVNPGREKARRGADAARKDPAAAGVSIPVAVTGAAAARKAYVIGRRRSMSAS